MYMHKENHIIVFKFVNYAKIIVIMNIIIKIKLIIYARSLMIVKCIAIKMEFVKSIQKETLI